MPNPFHRRLSRNPLTLVSGGKNFTCPTGKERRADTESEQQQIATTSPDVVIRRLCPPGPSAPVLSLCLAMCRQPDTTAEAKPTRISPQLKPSRRRQRSGKRANRRASIRLCLVVWPFAACDVNRPARRLPGRRRPPLRSACGLLGAPQQMRDGRRAQSEAAAAAAIYCAMGERADKTRKPRLAAERPNDGDNYYVNSR